MRPVLPSALALTLLLATLAGCAAVTDVVHPSLVVTVTAPQRGVVGPLAGARVLLSDDIHGGTTGADGVVAMYGVRPGPYNLTVLYGHQEARRAVRATNGTVALAVRLNETARADLIVHVAASAADGVRPVADATVLLSDNVHGGRTDASGAYRFFGLEDGAYNVTVAWQGREQVRGARVGGAPVELEFRF